jgi:hypothetical protein
MLKLLKKLKELVFGKTTPAVVKTPKVEACEIKPIVETPVIETPVAAPKKKFKHKHKPQPKNS